MLLLVVLLAMGGAVASGQTITNVFTGSAANDGTGTALRTAFNRINTNFWLLTNTYPAAWTNAALKAAQDATNDLNTAIAVKLANGTNHTALATNNLNTALVTKLTDATNDLNTALVAKITASTNDYKVREVAVSGEGSQVTAVTNTSTGLITLGLSATLTNQVTGALFQVFTNWADATNRFVLSPTNGNWQQVTLTNVAYIAMDATATNLGSTIRLTILGSNSITWTTSNLSNAAAATMNQWGAELLLDRRPYTNLWVLTRYQ